MWTRTNKAVRNRGPVAPAAFCRAASFAYVKNNSTHFSERAALSVFGGHVDLKNNLFANQSFDIEAETYDGYPATFDDLQEGRTSSVARLGFYVSSFRRHDRRIMLAAAVCLCGLTFSHPADHVDAAATALSVSAVASPVPAAPASQSSRPGMTAETLPQVGAPGALSLDPALAAMVDQAKADLARRHSVATEKVTLIEIRSIVWPDRGLGCPRPGVEHPQVPADGFLIRLGLGGRVFDYHQGRGRPPFLCERSG